MTKDWPLRKHCKGPPAPNILSDPAKSAWSPAEAGSLLPSDGMPRKCWKLATSCSQSAVLDGCLPRYGFSNAVLILFAPGRPALRRLQIHKLTPVCWEGDPHTVWGTAAEQY